MLLSMSSLIYSFTPEEEAKIQHYVKHPTEGEGFLNSIHKALGTKTGKILEEAERRRNSSLSNKNDTKQKDSKIPSDQKTDPFDGFDYTGDHFNTSNNLPDSKGEKQKEGDVSGNLNGSVKKSDSLTTGRISFNIDKVQDDQKARQADKVILEQEARTAQSQIKDLKLEEEGKVVAIDFSDKSKDTSDSSSQETKKKTKKDTQKIDLNSLSKLLDINSKDILTAQKEEIEVSLQKMIDTSFVDPLYHSYNEFLQKHLNKVPGKFVTKFFEKFDQNISISIVDTMSLEHIQYIPKDYFEKQDNLYKETKTALPEFDKNRKLFIDIVKNGIESISSKDIENMDSKTREIFVKNLSPENTKKLSADQIKKILHDKNAQNSLKVIDLSSSSLVGALTKGTFATKEISLTPEFKKSLTSSQIESLLKVSRDQLRLSTSDYQDIAKRFQS